MMISEAMNAKLNKQVAAEFEASHKYLGMACSLDAMGLKMLSKFFEKQADEERGHALKIVRYLQEVGAAVTLDSVPTPQGEYESVEQLVQTALQAEIGVTNMINDLVTLADKEKDYATRSFLNWFVDEQVEEVSTMTDLLNLVKLSRGNLLQIEAVIRHKVMGPS